MKLFILLLLLVGQLEPIYSSSVRIRVVAQGTYRKRWTIGKGWRERVMDIRADGTTRLFLLLLLVGQQEPTYSSSVRIRVVALGTYRKRWTIGKGWRERVRDIRADGTTKLSLLLLLLLIGQLEPTYSSSVRIRVVALGTYRKRWTIGKGWRVRVRDLQTDGTTRLFLLLLLVGQLEPTYSSSVGIRVVVLGTYRKRWTIGSGGEWGSGISVLMVWQDYYYHYYYCYWAASSNLHTAALLGYRL